MKATNHTSLRQVTPYAWAGALLFFAITEALVLMAERHSLSGVSLIRRWSLPAALTGPLVVGFNLTRIVGKYSDDPDHREIAALASASIAVLMLVAYALVTGTLTVFL